MANPHLQQARQRKMYYWGAVAVLFTVSLIHRYWIINDQARLLQLRETVRGEVELTSSAVRLMLTGSRGLAVTMLWYNAMDKQKRGEWHELELLVKSITRLQPYFITPWLYQSWNISFNVAVECDKPRDKYYYISRGLELLAEGERRNRGTGDDRAGDDPDRIVFPGHPELRHYMGFTYQLKIGTSDEHKTMRCLLEMSCIDPVERNPDLFLTKDQRNRPAVKVKEFVDFAHKHPRLVRRLREGLSRDPLAVVEFLKEYKDIPNRFKPPRLGTATQSELKDPLDQFPILPPPEDNWPDPKSPDLTSESIDVFLVCRTWYQFAQKPLPPPIAKPKTVIPDYDKLRYRVPKGMMTILFRQYPARAQVYIAETLESEGWFDNEGWDLAEGFDKPEFRSAGDEPTMIGKDSKFHSRRAWDSGFQAYRDFGLKNGVYIPPGELKELKESAKHFRKTARPGKDILPEELPPAKDEWLGASYDAHTRIYFSEYYRRLANFDAFLYQAEAERDPVTATARKLLFRAGRMHKRHLNERTIKEYDKAWPWYVHACLKFPRFAQVASMQEDFTEAYQRYLGATQELYPEVFRQAALTAARVTVPAAPDWRALAAHHNIAFRRFYPQDAHASAWVTVPAMPDWHALAIYHKFAFEHYYPPVEHDKGQYQLLLQSISKIKMRTGELDRVQYYNREGAAEVRDALYLFTQGTLMSMNQSATTFAFPSQASYFLTRLAPEVDDIPEHWTPLISSDSRRIARNRIGLDK